jgi:uncharacterized RDD family membrane protein YckC
MNEITKTLALFAGIVVGAILVSALCAFPTMWLWNWLMPEIFGLKTITFLQSWGLMILSNILFNSGYSRKSKE